MKTEKFASGSYIFKEGDSSQQAYRIIRGKVELTTDVDSKPVILAQLGKGDIFGEMAMIDERPRSASAQCLKPTECEVMQPGDFQSVILDQPARSLPYLSALFERLRSVTNRLQHEGRGEPKSQVSPLENEVPIKPTPIEADPFSPFQMQTESQQETAVSSIILTPLTPTCSSVMPAGYEAMQLVKFPFCIGRKPRWTFRCCRHRGCKYLPQTAPPDQPRDAIRSWRPLNWQGGWRVHLSWISPCSRGCRHTLWPAGLVGF